jgi:hypothetical protein
LQSVIKEFPKAAVTHESAYKVWQFFLNPLMSLSSISVGLKDIESL